MLDASLRTSRPIPIGEITNYDWHNILRPERVNLAKMDDINPMQVLIPPHDYDLSNAIPLMRIDWGIR